GFLLDWSGGGRPFMFRLCTVLRPVGTSGRASAWIASFAREMTVASVTSAVGSVASVIAAVAALITVFLARTTVLEARRARSEARTAHEEAMVEWQEARRAAANQHRDEMTERARAFSAEITLQRVIQVEHVVESLVDVVDTARSEAIDPPPVM